MSIYPSISCPCCVLICFASCAEKVLPMKNCFFLWTNTSEVEQKQFGADQKSDRMENFALGQQISNGLVRIGNITGRLSSEWLPRKAHQVSLIPQIHHKASHHRLQVGEMCSGTKLAQILQTCILWIFCLGKASIIFCPKHWWLKLGNMLQLPADLYLQINLN